MSLDEIELPIPTRRALIEQHLRFRRVWNPGIDTSEGGEPYLDAVVAADTMLPLVAHARRVSQAAIVSRALTSDVEFWGDIHGVEASPATGSIGLVRITASVGGGEIQKGDALTIRGRSNGPRIECQVTGRYYDGDAVPVVAVDTGAATNLDPGAILEWYQPPAGIGTRAVVIDQDGDGLTGGREAASPEEHKSAILDKLRDPPGAENDAHYRFEARRAGVPVKQAFSYPAVLGPGTTALALLVHPNRKGGMRSPTSQQMQRVLEHLQDAFGADDSILIAFTLQSPVTVAFGINWAGGYGWAQSSPWPVYGPPATRAIVVTAVSSALSFTLGTANGSYAGVLAPTVGKRIALYDRAAAHFVEKRIGAVSGSGPWVITVDTLNRASDENYTPVVGQRVSPWSESLQLVADATLGAFEQLGPGEMHPPSIDFMRRRRHPEAPAQWPYRITQDLLEGAVSPRVLGAIADRELREGDGLQPLVGTPGVTAYILVLGDLAVFPKS